MATSSASGTTVPSSSFTQRVSTFASENRKLLVGIAAGAVVVGGGYYYYSTSQTSSRKPRKTGRRKSKAEGTAKPAEHDAARSAADLEKAEGASSSADATKPQDVLQMSSEAISALDMARRKDLAAELKSRGNKQYQARKYASAAELYTKAIECDEQAVFYSNRAACYTNLNKPQAVIDDCNSALRLDGTYVKAISRRASAYENQNTEESLYSALCDYTTACILEQFTRKETSDAVERVMKHLSAVTAERMLKQREPRLPSSTFIQAYLDAFRKRAKPALPESPSQGDQTLLLAFDALEAKDYPHAASLFNESVEQGFSSNELHARALNMRGTFRFIMGMANEALQDLDCATNLDSTDSQTWVKKASVHMELGDPVAAMKDFETAQAVNKDDSDVFYHRGQVYFIQEKYALAISEYQKASALDGEFIFSQIQHAVSLYKEGKKEKAAHAFKRYINKFGAESGEVHNYYGELLLDQQNYEEAARSFDTAIALEKKKPGPLNVLPMVNKALCLFQWKQDFDGAEALCKTALEHDESCDVAVATYAQLLLQRNKVREAVEMFHKGAELARTEKELENALNFELATRAQIHFIDLYPQQAASLGLTNEGPLVPR